MEDKNQLTLKDVKRIAKGRYDTWEWSKKCIFRPHMIAIITGMILLLVAVAIGLSFSSYVHSETYTSDDNKTLSKTVTEDMTRIYVDGQSDIYIHKDYIQIGDQMYTLSGSSVPDTIWIFLWTAMIGFMTVMIALIYDTIIVNKKKEKFVEHWVQTKEFLD